MKQPLGYVDSPFTWGAFRRQTLLVIVILPFLITQLSWRVYLFKTVLKPYMHAPKLILIYMQDTLSTLTHRLHLRMSSVNHLVSYTDAYLMGSSKTHRSTFGFYVFLGDNLISWSSKPYYVVSCSSVNVEFRALLLCIFYSFVPLLYFVIM